jgi:putative methyltransferase
MGTSADRICFQLTPILSLLLVHDLLLAKRGIALPATHGLRTAIERHKGRLQAELTRARVQRKLGSLEALKTYIEVGQENGADTSEAPYPRWIRINTLKTTLEDQLETTFAGYDRAITVNAVRHRGSKHLYIDEHIPNLVAISPSVDLSKSEAYKSGAIIFQDKASCFPAYFLDPLTEDGDIIDTCSAPGNKTTHVAAILLGHNAEPDECTQTIHAFEKSKGRAETLEAMVNLAGSHVWTTLHPGQDFLRVDPKAPDYKNVGALLLDPSCSGSGIIGRDEMPELHLPDLQLASGHPPKNPKKDTKAQNTTQETRKRKREDPQDQLDVMVDDDGVVTAVNTDDELKSRLAALSTFQLELLLHAFKFPAARKITYSTCSIHAEENEFVAQKALESAIAKERGWRLLKREEQIRGMREWPVRGSPDACGQDDVLAESYIRANKRDEYGTMGFFLAGFVRDEKPAVNVDAEFLRDERGHLVRDLLGFPVRKLLEDLDDLDMGTLNGSKTAEDDMAADEEEWAGFADDDIDIANSHAEGEIEPAEPVPQSTTELINRHSHNLNEKRPNLGAKIEKRQRKSKSS